MVTHQGRAHEGAPPQSRRIPAHLCVILSARRYQRFGASGNSGAVQLEVHKATSRRQAPVPGPVLVDWLFTFGAAAYNIVRLSHSLRPSEAGMIPARHVARKS